MVRCFRHCGARNNGGPDFTEILLGLFAPIVSMIIITVAGDARLEPRIHQDFPRNPRQRDELTWRNEVLVRSNDRNSVASWVDVIDT